MPVFEQLSCVSPGNHTTSFLAGGPQDGPLMIFCHGWPAIGKTWLPQLEAFAELGFRVVAPDMPGYGRSTVSNKPEDYSLESVNSIMGALLAHLNRDSAIWIGHDWGAVAVWSFAAVSRFLLLSPHILAKSSTALSRNGLRSGLSSKTISHS